MEPTTLTREDLYDLVWTTPASRLAPKFGLSDVGLSKICKKHQIPRPPVGYWQKLEFGKNPAQTPLPKADDPNLEHVCIWPSNPSEPCDRRSADSDELRFAIEFENDGKNLIIVSDHLRQLHPLVKWTMDEMNSRDAKPDTRLSPGYRNEDCLNIHVSKASLHRALRIMNALMHAFEKRGLTVSASNSNRERITAVKVNGEDVRIRIEEPYRQIDYVPTPKQRAETERYSWRSYPKYDHVPSGILVLKIESLQYTGARQNWRDRKNKPLELQLNDFMIGLHRGAVAIKARKAEREARERKWQEEAKRQQEAIRRQEREQAKREELLRQSESWFRAQNLRSYLEAAECSLGPKAIDNNSQEAFAEWLCWGRAIADEIDPLCLDDTEDSPIESISNQEQF